MVVDNQAIAGLAMKALEMAFARGIGARGLDNETVVDGDTLTAHSGMTRIRLAAIGLVKLGLSTDGTRV